jgi:LDH2 family malate/lactate/ureidoglycolate dehydrogenase
MITPWLTGSNKSIRQNTQNIIMAAIDISAFTDLEIFTRQVDELIEAIKNLPKAEGVDEIYIPGEIEENIAIERMRDGIPLPPGTVEKLRNAGKLYDVKLPQWLVI